MKIVCPFVVVLFILSFPLRHGYSQSVAIDSMRSALKTYTDDETRTVVLLALGQAFMDENYLDSALDKFHEVLVVAPVIKDKRSEAIALMGSGALTAHYLGNYGQGLSMLFRASQLFDQIGAQEGIIEVSMVLQGIYREAGDYPNALKHEFIVNRAVQKNDAKGIFIFQELRILPLVLAEIGETYQYMNKLDSAEFYTRQSIKENLMFNGATWNFPIYLLGKIQTKQGNYVEALRNYKTAIPLAKANGIFKDTLDIYNSIAELQKHKGNLDSAVYYAKSITGTPFLSINILLTAEMTLADAYGLKHSMDSAFKYLTLSSVLKDSVYSTERQKQFQSATFNEQLRLQELALQEKDSRRKIVMYALVGGLVAFLVIALLLYRNNLHKQKAKVKIEKAFDELKATQKQLIQSEKMASLGELTAGIAHEIQNPLNFVNNFSEVNTELISEMKKELAHGNGQAANELANTIEENEQKINHHGKRADGIVKSMLLHSRSSSGQRELTDINAMCDEYVRFAYHGYKAKDKTFNANINTDFDKAIPKINVVTQDVGRVILNLINNAFYEVTEKSRTQGDSYVPSVNVSTKWISGKIIICVKDNGRGIPKEIREKIFQPFFSTKPTGQGTGLGLSLSYDIIKSHDGTLDVNSKEGEGSEFVIGLPV